MEEINDFVKTNFNMDLNDFLKQKVEIESLYNYEIAALLNVDKAVVGKLIRQSGLRRKNGFIRRFERLHGKGSVNKFKNMIERLDTSLSDVARYFGFSREYARQAHQNLFDRPYTETLHHKRVKKKGINDKAKKKFGKLKLIEDLKLRLTTMGLGPQVLHESSQYKFIVNGYKLSFRFSQRPHKVSGRRQFRITYLNSDRHRDSDFLICLCIHGKEKIYYVLPKHVIPKHGICFIPEAPVNKSKYACYKEAWEPLFQANNDIGERSVCRAEIKSNVMDDCQI